MCMTNLFAFRATHPREMMRQPDPVGRENNQWLQTIAEGAALIVACWGAGGDYQGRDSEVKGLMDGFKCLRKTKHGFPAHPLRIPYSSQLQDWP